MTVRVELTDDELVLLDGRVGEKAQKEVAAARARIQARGEYPGLSAEQAGLIADIVTEATENGEVIYQHCRVNYCPVCKVSAGYVPYKSGRNKGRANLSRPRSLPGIEFARRFVRFEGSVAIGGCQECILPIVDHLRSALAGVPAQLPEHLVTEGAARFKKYDNRSCSACGWSGHEGQMGRRRTLMGDGTYPAVCPSCGAENHIFGERIIGSREGFTVEPVEVPAVPEGKE